MILARIQRVIVLALLVTEAAAVGLAITESHVWVAIVFPLAAVLVYASVLAVEFSLLRRSYHHNDRLAPTGRQIRQACIGEILSAPRVFLWRQPFFEHSVSDCLASPCAGQRGVVLVHGFFCNRAIWNPWLRTLTQRRVPFIAVTSEPVLGSIDDYRADIAEAVSRITDATSMAPVIVAHSMGGLAVRAWLATQGDARIAHRIVTIASPHSGTRMAGRGVARNVGEMRIGSEWLEDLWSRESPMTRARFICFWSHCDNIVFPTRNATMPEADNRHLPATAHVHMALHPAALEAVLELVA